MSIDKFVANWPPKEMQQGKLEWSEIQFSSLNFVKGSNFRNKINEAAGALSKAELLSVQNRDREAWIGSVNQEEFARLKRIYPDMQFDIISYVAPFKGFAHGFKPGNSNDPNAFVHIVMSKRTDIGTKYRELNKQGGSKLHQFLGEVLNYPVCCTSFFSQWWQNTQSCCQTHFDLVWHSATTTDIERLSRSHDNQLIKREEPYPEVNPYLRYIGIRFVNYMPCSLRCLESQKYGRMIASYIDEPIRSFMYEQLKQPMKWDRLHGIVMIATEKYWVFNHTDYTADNQIIFLNGYTKERKYGKLIDVIRTKTGQKQQTINI